MNWFPSTSVTTEPCADATAIGVSFAMISVSIFVPVLLIGAITFVVCLGGYFLGAKLGHRINLRLEQVEKRYRAQFTALDTMLASMQQTSSYLSQQLAALAQQR